jgi:5-methylcytosine-specific restriction endonuclease McrA
MSKSVHYIHEGNRICSTTGESLDTSESILTVSCGHCWKRYDELDNREANVPELEDCARLMRSNLESAIRTYESDSRSFQIGRTTPIVLYAYWFLIGKEKMPEEVRSVCIPKENRDFDMDLGKLSSRMRAPSKLRSIWGKRYKEQIDRALRALDPVLVEPKSNQGGEVPESLRAEAWSRSPNKFDACEMCNTEFVGGSPNAPEAPTIDHIVPRSMGGPDEAWNLRPMCRSCNSFKNNVLDPSGVERIAQQLRSLADEDNKPGS